MSIKRHTGSGFSEVSTRKRWNGSAWVNLTIGKRWNGTAWVDLWSDSSGSSGDSSGSGSGTSTTPTSGSGTISTVQSTASTPTVNYSASYTWTKSGTSLTVPVKFAAWISSSSKLGIGIKLTIYARLNGGAWTSAVIKSTSAVWSGSAKHYASVSLTGNANTTNTIEWYVTRDGSTYSGSAGKLGSSSSPKKHTFTA